MSHGLFNRHWIAEDLKIFKPPKSLFINEADKHAVCLSLNDLFASIANCSVVRVLTAASVAGVSLLRITGTAAATSSPCSRVCAIDDSIIANILCFVNFSGAKRYILLPPSECKRMYMWPRDHPEGSCSIFELCGVTGVRLMHDFVCVYRASFQS